MTGERSAPDVSVVVPAYQARRWIDASLRSLGAQTHRSYEVIVVDDGSTDGTGEAAERFGVRVLRTGHRGAGAARDAGAAVAGGEVIVFLDADEIYALDFLEQLVAPLADPDVKGTFPGGMSWHNPGEGFAPGWLHVRGFPGGRLPERGPTRSFPKALRRRDFERVGGYPHAGFGSDEIFGQTAGPAIVVPGARYRFGLPSTSREIFRKSRWIGRGPRFELERPLLRRITPPSSLANAARLLATGEVRAAWVRLLYDAGRLLGYLESRLRPELRDRA